MKLYTFKEVSEILRIHPKTLGRYIKAGTGPKTVKVGCKKRITEEALQEYIDGKED